MYYFAYGSNMNHKKMLETRCKGSKFVGRAYLYGYKFVYDQDPSLDTWQANIAKRKGSRVIGGLFNVTKEHLKKLDRYEDYPVLYNRIKKKVMDEGGKKFIAWIYFRRETKLGKPSKIYQKEILEGARDCRIPQYYIKKYLLTRQ